jgi:hypothetical protein
VKVAVCVTSGNESYFKEEERHMGKGNNSQKKEVKKPKKDKDVKKK